MISSLLLTSLLAATPAPASTQGPLAIRVGHAESITQGTLEHAVILIEDGKITAVGEDLPIEDGITILDRPDWVVTPGLVNCYSRMGLSSRAGNQFEPQLQASAELVSVSFLYGRVLEHGVTTLGLVPAGSGITGQAVAIRTKGSTPAGLILKEGAYLTLALQTNAGSKKAWLKGFDSVISYQEGVEKEREKFDKKASKKKKKKKSKSKKKDDKAAEFTPKPPGEKVKPFNDVLEGRLSALVNIRKASDWLHLQDVIGDNEFDFSLRCPLRNDIDLYEVKEAIGETGLHFVTTPTITLQVGTNRARNLPAELAAAGAKLAFVPSRDSSAAYDTFMFEVGQLVSEGLSREDAFYALTLGPATVLGVADQLGSLDVDKTANLILWDGDPFEPTTKIQAVMLDGQWVFEEDDATE